MTQALALEKLPGADMFSLDVQRVVGQTIAIRQVIKTLMREGEHYGVVPGTEKYDERTGEDISKRTLYQPGADLLCLLFRLRPKFDDTLIENEGFIYVKVRCSLVHIPTGEVWSEGMGSANSRESRYLNQATQKICPQCRKPTIFRSKKEGEGWFCWRKKDGCGATFRDGDKSIEGQIGQVATDKIWGLHNTILKIACKRSKVAAVLTATAASDIFTQDLEDDVEADVESGDQETGAASPETQAAARPAGKAANGNGGKRATPVQVRDLNIALNELDVSLESRLPWVSSNLNREVASMDELSSADAAGLIQLARQQKEERR